MQIKAIQPCLQNYRFKSVSKSATINNQQSKNINSIPFMTPFVKVKQNHITISFMGKPVHIVDGGNHADNMKHFIKAINKDVDVTMHDVEVNSRDKNTKQLYSLENELKKLNQNNSSLKGHYVAIPALASVALLNIQDQYNAVMGENRQFTPENIKSNKKDILTFLKKLYDEPQKYEKYINYLDSNSQGIRYVYGVIKEINNLIEKDARVYIPSGHPQAETLKWAAASKGLKPELYHYIATGEDINNSITDLHEEIKYNNWYDFNLLALSDANIVGVKDINGAQDYMFAAYDSCITDGARGVYNFSPVRAKEGNIIGYSYTDTTTNQYPYSEFPANSEVSNLNVFVGKKLADVLASEEETQNFLDAIKENKNIYNLPKKLYKIEDIFTEEEIENKKIKLMGKYVDRTKEVFFDTNKKGEVIFSKCDCEGSGKPSVLPMWGSCFAVFNAISRDIVNLQEQVPYGKEELHNKEMHELITGSCGYEEIYKNANAAIALDKAFHTKNPSSFQFYEPYMQLGDYYFTCGDFEKSEELYNNAINFLSARLVKRDETNLSKIESDYSYNESKQIECLEYDCQIENYNKLSRFQKWFNNPPTKPEGYDNFTFDGNVREQRSELFDLERMFSKLQYILEKLHKTYPAEICHRAAKDIHERTARGEKVLERRADGVAYIGDLYNEVEPY